MFIIECYVDGARITTYQNTVLIFNPNAGRMRRKGGRLITQAESLLRAAGHNVILKPTTGPNTAAGIARDSIKGGADLVIAVGGDGTINEVANGMVGSRTPLAILPGGTANVLATEMGIGRSIQYAVEQLAHSREERISVGALTVEGAGQPRYFLMMTGVGLDAHIVYNINLGLKAKIGKLAYWLAGFSLVGRRLTTFSAALNQQQHTVGFALVSRVANYGGDLTIARGAHLLDRDFEVVLFESSNTFLYVKYMLGAVVGRLSGMKGITIQRSGRVELAEPARSRVYLQADGEYIGHLPATIEIVPDALTILVPEPYWQAGAARRG